MQELVRNNDVQKTQSLKSNDMFEVMEKAYRFSQIMAKSDIIPVHYREKPENVFVAIQTAYRMNLDPMLVMQNTFVVSGKLGMNSTFAISLANSSGLFLNGIRYKVEGQGDELRVTAYATLKSNEEEITYTIGMHEAKAEGWTKNSKYKTLPELMLRYRAATLLIRTHVPEVINGMHMVEEIEDVAASKTNLAPRQIVSSKLDGFLAKQNEQQPKPDLHEKLESLIELNNIPQETVEKWCKAGGVDSIGSLDISKVQSCISYIESKDTLGGTHG